MRAMLLDEPKPARQRPLRLAEVVSPTPGPGEVLIAVTACGVCRTDLHVVEGELPVRVRPLIPGHQVVGTICTAGDGVPADRVGQRVGVAWLSGTCGSCRFCLRGDENLCDCGRLTGWTHDGGYAEFIVAPDRFVYALPEGFSDLEVAPLLCAGMIGYRCLRQCAMADWRGVRLGLYGFGAAGHIAIQLARHRGAEVFVCTRDRKQHQALAEQLGAVWVGDTFDRPPAPLDAAIVFAPAGEIVPAALRALDRGGRLVLGGIHMSEIPPIDYQDLYQERVIRSVANNTREDGLSFLSEAAEVGVTTHTTVYPLEQANEALIELKHGAIRGAGVLTTRMRNGAPDNGMGTPPLRSGSNDPS